MVVSAVAEVVIELGCSTFYQWVYVAPNMNPVILDMDFMQKQRYTKNQREKNSIGSGRIYLEFKKHSYKMSIFN